MRDGREGAGASAKIGNQAARQISEDLLERSGASLVQGDFETFADCFLLPQDMETFEGRRSIETRDQMREIFEAVRQFHQRSGVTELVRHCVEAEFRTEDIVEATHESRLVAGERLIQRPYPVFSVLKRVDGVWRVASSQYAIVDAPGLNQALIGDALDEAQGPS